MKKMLFFFVILFLLSACSAGEDAGIPEDTLPASVTENTVIPTDPLTDAVLPETTEPPVPVMVLTEEEKTMLLKLAMAEKGDGECTECIALIMRTVLNRVESSRFGSSIHSVIFAQDQFTPVSEGSYHTAEPNERCREALDMVLYGWDESQGALFYEWCEGESWHSRNLHMLFQHCDIRFYD